MATKEEKKGVFGALRLAVSRKYIFPDRRKAMMVTGGLVALAVVAYFLVDFFLLGNRFTTTGPLSSSHATFEKDCAKCHAQFDEVTNAKCSICHEKAGDDLGAYTFAGHYVFRSGDVRRISTSAKKHAGQEDPCYSCHQEHLGRNAAIINVPDARCIECHAYGSFNKNHPQFDFAAEKIPDDSTMKFTHIRHVKEVVKRENLADMERACLYCHNPQPDGKHFDPIEFDLHCDTCHLTSGVETPALKIKTADDPISPGVGTLESIRQRRGPGTSWAFYMSTNEFTSKAGGAKVVKSPLYHEDPWILENLKMIRRRVYPDSGVADLLKTSGMPASHNTRNASLAIYNEALQALQSYSVGLRGHPDSSVQRDLAMIDSLLKISQSRIRRASSSLTDSLFTLQPAMMVNPALNMEQIDDLRDLALNVAKPCLECHIVSDAGIQRVQKNQQILNRAEFDHRAHIVERRCLECHIEIPIVHADGDTTAVKPSQDRAAIQNIPQIENCIDCHNPKESSNRCVTCHYFHPNKTNRSMLLLYLD